MDQDFIIHINRQERTQAMEGVEQAVSQVYDNKEQPKEKLAAGVLEAVQNAMARGDRAHRAGGDPQGGRGQAGV